MKKIIVTEKPSVARSFAKALGVYGNEDGYIENNEWIITWCVGHLVTMAYPQEYDENLKRWSFDTLPFLPEQYRYKVIPEVRKQFKVIKTLYNRSDIDTIYYAGDPAREGIYIQSLVRQMAGTKSGIKELVVWIDSQTDAEIKRGIKEAKDLSEYNKLIASGYERAIEDYAVGINFSRALTLKANQTVGRLNSSINVGRVMTCVLGMIVRREREIKNFVSTDYFKVQSGVSLSDGQLIATWRPSNDTYAEKLYNENGFLKKEDAENLMKKMSHKIEIEDVSIKEERRNAPLLFNLAELQAACSKAFKISPDETLAIAQSLYEKRMTTYPRTDARYLSTAIAVEIEDNLIGLRNIFPAEVDAILESNSYKGIASSKYTNDAKVTDHYAIIPTGNVSSLSGVEKEVYLMIVRRFLSIFLPPAVYTKVNIIEIDPICKERFFASGKTLKSAGFLSLYGSMQEESNLPGSVMSLKKGDIFECKYRILSSKTTPPARYTSGSMILAMENAGKLIEDETLREQIKGSGIGTSATRAETLKKLERIGYIKSNKKTQVLTPDDLGYFVYDFVEIFLPELLNAELTAQWEQGLDEIACGKTLPKEYRDHLNHYVESNVEDIRSRVISEEDKQILMKYKAKEGTNDKKQPRVKAANVETYLSVPFADKDEVKALGAYFDATKKAWYVPKGKDVSAFSKWMGDKKVTSIKKVYVNTPFSMKDSLKEAGAYWDPNKKKWYFQSTNKRLSEFKDYIAD